MKVLLPKAVNRVGAGVRNRAKHVPVGQSKVFSDRIDDDSPGRGFSLCSSRADDRVIVGARGLTHGYSGENPRASVREHRGDLLIRRKSPGRRVCSQLILCVANHLVFSVVSENSSQRGKNEFTF